MKKPDAVKPDLDNPFSDATVPGRNRRNIGETTVIRSAMQQCQQRNRILSKHVQ